MTGRNDPTIANGMAAMAQALAQANVNVMQG